MMPQYDPDLDLSGLSDDELDLLLGMRRPAADFSPEPSYQGGGLGRFLEGMSGLEAVQRPRPRGFGEGLVGGLSRGLGVAGTRAATERQRFEIASQRRQMERDAANLEASRDYRKERGQALRDLTGRQRDDKRRSDEYERDNPTVTPEMVGQFPQFGRLVGKRIAKSQLDEAMLRKPETAAKPEKERVVQIMGAGGVPIWAKESDAIGQPAAQAARAVTGQERQALAYFNRAQDAITTLETPDRTGASLEQRMAGIGQQIGLQYAPNVLKSPDQRAYRQAQRAFTEARLRKESGAAIPVHEYEQDAATYFAQPGDDPATIEQKRKARQVVLDGLKFGSGKAYDEFYGGAASFPGSAQSRTTSRDATQFWRP